MKIRDFVESDRNIYIDMANDFYSGDATISKPDMDKFKNTFDRVIEKSPYIRGLIIEYQNKTVGYCLLAFTWICEAGGNVVWIDELYIKSEFRGNGLGSEFMKWVIEKYKNEHTTLRLEVCPENLKVKKLYESYGFKQLGYLQMVN